MVVNNKQAALKIIEQMPDDVSLEDIMHELYFRQRVDRGLKESEEGKLIPHDEVMREIAEWLRSSGRPARGETSAT
jgi:predicted transcriptional regulator